MAKLFQVELQLITDDKGTCEKVEKLMEKALSTLKLSGDIIVQPCGTLDDEEEEEEEEEDGEDSGPY